MAPLKASLRAFLLVFAAVFAATAAPAVEISFRYRSPRNPERKVRRSTDFIVLHTTEAPARSSINKVSDRGECHFVVTEEGSVYAIVDRDREAFHAGRSMWNGREDVDKFSVGIECVGYHDKPMTSVQLDAIRALVKDLQRMYRLGDECVVCHSHVAYGAPNRWHRTRHRGRKRCGMLFAMPSIRARLGLKQRPAYDPDVRARRLVVGDAYLNSVLYGRVDTMRGRVAAPASSGGGFFNWFSGGSSPAKSVPKQAPKRTANPKPVVKAAPAKTVKPAAKGTTPAAKPKPVVKAAAKKPAVQGRPQSVADLKARGWVMKGTVSKTVTASKIAGARWRSSDTYYTIRNKVIPGNCIDAAHIELGMSVWLRP